MYYLYVHMYVCRKYATVLPTCPQYVAIAMRNGSAVAFYYFQFCCLVVVVRFFLLFVLFFLAILFVESKTETAAENSLKTLICLHFFTDFLKENFKAVYP